MHGTTAQRIAGAIGRLPLLATLLRHPRTRRALERVPGAEALYATGWDRTHPFDRLHGTDTSGVVAASELPLDQAARVHAICYAGSQPGVLRQALALLPDVDTFAFVDLGCGKGRALIVATEFPFRDILGVELSPALAAVARRNAALLARRHPGRVPVRIAVADASTFALPGGDVVLYLYHPFGAELVAHVVARVEAALAIEDRRIYVVYYNPVAGHCFDASSRLRRRFAGTLPYAADERGYGPDESDVVVIWQGGPVPAPAARADARIVLAEGGRRAVLADR